MQPEVPSALHGEPLGTSVAPRKITLEQNIMHQIDRIGYLRSIGESWSEPLFHLRDLMVGLEDDEFWTGIPKGITPKNNKEKKQYYERSWEGVEMFTRIIEHPDGETEEVPDPSPQQLSKMLRIIMALLARQGMSWRSRNVDEIRTQAPEQ